MRLILFLVFTVGVNSLIYFLYIYIVLYTIEFEAGFNNISSKANTWPIYDTSVRNRHKLNDWIFRFPVHIQIKVDDKNYNQRFMKHDEDNNSQF